MERFAHGRAPALGRDSQRYKSAYPFGAICPAEGTGAALVMPRADTRAMQAHLKEISRTITPGAHAVLLLDRAGWHTTSKLSIPNNVSLVFLPPRSPDLRTKWTRSGNPVENVWPYLRQTHLSNRVFETYRAILDAASDAWNRLIEKPYKIMSLGLRPRAYTAYRQ